MSFECELELAAAREKIKQLEAVIDFMYDALGPGADDVMDLYYEEDDDENE